MPSPNPLPSEWEGSQTRPTIAMGGARSGKREAGSSFAASNHLVPHPGHLTEDFRLPGVIGVVEVEEVEPV